MYKVFYVIFLNILFSMGLKSILIPIDAYSMSSSNAGIASSSSINLNPAIIMDKKSNSLSFSLNNWLYDIKGKTLQHYWKKKYFYINSYDIDDIEVRGDIPKDNPISTITVSWISAGIGYGYNVFNSNLKLGFEVQGIYSRLYTETTTGITLKIGSTYAFNDKLRLGLVIKNFGYLNSRLNEEFPIESGLGASWKINNYILVKSDIVYNKIYKLSNRSAIDLRFKHFVFTGSFSNLGTNQYLSCGIRFKYKNWSIIYGLMAQSVSSLGLPQSLQLILHY